MTYTDREGNPHPPDAHKAQIIERDNGDPDIGVSPILVIVAPCQCGCGRSFSTTVRSFNPQF